MNGYLGKETAIERMNNQLTIQVVQSAFLSDEDRKPIIALCNRACEEDLEPLFNTFVGATHVLGYHNGLLASHALWVTRDLQVGNSPLLRTAYIEALATDPAYRGRGFATAIMKRVADEIQDYELAALSPSSVAFYERLGWELWHGPLFIRTQTDLLPSPDQEQVMILRLPKTPPLDLNAPLSAEWREGELW
ncbi:predicted acetyltransferase [Bellilinea caldifistulae]|nr:GNAT family N-acetyltransferase [Bellilinea caldifistulae]GAP09476.1 predicted acetyltransferase [Bellilinea caldifistulae]